MATTSLYERLGGSSGIAMQVDDIVSRHLDNPVIGARFRPYLEAPDRLAATKRHLCEFLEAGSGGPARYAGRSMQAAHRGMNIGAAEYMAAVDDILASLRQHRIDDQTQKDVLAIAWGLKGEILHV
jgi:hemoglobin